MHIYKLTVNIHDNPLSVFKDNGLFKKHGIVICQGMETMPLKNDLFFASFIKWHEYLQKFCHTLYVQHDEMAWLFMK